MSLLAIVVALGLLIFLAYRGVSVLVLAPTMALLAVLGSPGTPLLASYTQIFMPALGQFVVMFFPLFLLGAIFGKLMQSTGAADVIAHTVLDRMGPQHTLLAVVLSCAVLTYGGVSLFVVAFAVYPVAQAMFVTVNLPKRLLPSTIALGAFTFTMTALPGTPAIQNAIPMPYFGTDPFAAPGLGVIGAMVMLWCGMMWLHWQVNKATRRGEGYGDHDDRQQPTTNDGVQEHEQITTLKKTPAREDIVETTAKSLKTRNPAVMQWNIWRALSPVGVVMVLNYALSVWLFPAMDASYLETPAYGHSSIDQVKGLWAVMVALSAAIVWILWCDRGRAKEWIPSISQGAGASVMPLMNTASQVGFGAVIASLAGFVVLKDWVLGVAPDNPLVSLSIAVNVLAGITGSASGGMSIALQTLGHTWKDMGLAQGISMELLHRVTAIATGGLDALPHNGAVITLLSICGLTHRESYKDIFVVAALIPLLALVVVVSLGSLLGSF